MAAKKKSKKAAEKKDAEKEAAEKVIVWELSDVEREAVRRIDKKENKTKWK